MKRPFMICAVMIAGILAAVITGIAIANPDPETVWIMPVGGVYYGDGYPEWIKESYVLTTTLSGTVSFDIEIHNDNNKASPDDLLLEIWINNQSYTSHISNITVDGNTTAGWYTGKHQGINGAYRNYTVGSIGANSIETLNITVVFTDDPPLDFQMHFDAHNSHWHTKQSHDATIIQTAPAVEAEAVISVDPPDTTVQPQDQISLNITVNPGCRNISAVQYDLFYNTSVVWAEWANRGPFLGDETLLVVCEIDNNHDVGEHIGKISYAEAEKGSDGNLTGINTSGTITTIHFSAIGVRNETSYLNITDVLIADPEKAYVPYQIENGTVLISPNQPPVAVVRSKHQVNHAGSKFQCYAGLCGYRSWDPDWWKGYNITYARWDFGDGQYGTTEGWNTPDPDSCQKQHKYTSWKWNYTTGTYDPFIVYLTVTDAGCPPLSNTNLTEVCVFIAGDANGDGVVNIFDAACVGKHWQETAPCMYPCSAYWYDEDDPNWVQSDEADLDNNNRVDIVDAMIVGTNWEHNAC